MIRSLTAIAMKILDAKQMRNIDARTVREYGISTLVLMENAGARATEALEELCEDLEHRGVLLLCSKGNNGGDGFVVARHLHNRGVQARVVLLCKPSEVRDDALVNLRILGKMGVEVSVAADAGAWSALLPDLERYDLIVDAILGTGLKGAVRGFLKNVISDLACLDAEVVALDIPSGLSADSPHVPGEAVVADFTLAMGLPKIPHVFPPAELFCGEVCVLDISLPAAAVDAEEVTLDLLEEDVVRRMLPTRARDSHKGDFGHVLVVAGSRSKPGAAALAALGCLRAGAGLVTVATGRNAQPMVHAHCAEAMVEPLPETEGGTLSRTVLTPILKMLDGVDAVVLGPGLGTATDVTQVIRKLVQKVELPMVLDADGLNAFASKPDMLTGDDTRPRILTPHPGEFARLLGVETKQVLRERLELTRRFAHDHHCFVVLKGYRTLVVTPSGRSYVNTTGNPGMATAGSGDVLSGIIGALVAQSSDVLPGILAAVYLHGLAGDRAAAHRGVQGLMASDILEHLPETMHHLLEGEFEEA
ncbi:MAG: NAD(P)H-hydrate dehydratase [Acidobacteria bacterium]|nr:MAG: NAD(P)H-hydrate dehydratase [Acidobacteriota bacterium]